MKRKPKIKRIENKETILADPAYWRIKAEIETMKAIATINYIRIIEIKNGVEIVPNSKEHEAAVAYFEKLHKEMLDGFYKATLEKLAKLSPEFAAAMDNRTKDELGFELE